MKYVINKIVTFYVAEKKLSGNDSEVLLSNPACRLLIALLENNGVQISREDLLTKVWDDFGLVSSESSLNNSISSLRKSLSQVGINNVLETIPKKGFVLHIDDLKLESITPDYLVSAVNISAGPVFNEHQFIKKILNKKYLSASILTLSMFFLLLTLYLNKKNPQQFQFYKKIDRCDIYYFAGVSEDRVKRFISSDEGINSLSGCNVMSDVYYDDNKNPSDNKIFETFIAVCSKNKEGNVSECKNYIYGRGF
ncbi:winged helix-turn-helix domain-containing protein [Enterobacter ludwigii]